MNEYVSTFSFLSLKRIYVEYLFIFFFFLVAHYYGTIVNALLIPVNMSNEFNEISLFQRLQTSLSKKIK